MKTKTTRLFIIMAIGMFFAGAIKGQFINNQTTLQSNANFNIDGTGTADVFKATTQYNIGFHRVLSVAGSFNAFVGIEAGINNTGVQNSFFGSKAGQLNTTGCCNSFNGFRAGHLNTTGGSNSFFGMVAGNSNTTGVGNSFFGRAAGFINGTGNNNSFYGFMAGIANIGSENSFFGHDAGKTNITGSKNTLIGRKADVGSGGLIFATAIGAEAVVSSSNTIQLGRANGSDTVNISGSLRVGIFGAGTGPLCRTRAGVISSCVSSIRYKSNVKNFSPGLSLIKRLRPVSFTWKDGNILDLGLIAEEVEKIEPLLVTKDKEGVVQGVKYNRIGVVLINAVQEQQKLIAKQRAEINALKRLVCSDHQTAAICR